MLELLLHVTKIMSMKSAYYQSRYRARLRQKGYVKREIWIPPEFTKILKNCETALRTGILPLLPNSPTGGAMSQDDWIQDPPAKTEATVSIDP